jgi:tripartite-type tricarboxylate transporter receptor subunit TctC
MKRILTCLMLTALATMPAITAATANPSSDFYRGKTIRFMVGTAAGGGFSTYALLLSAFMGKHIPGSPSFAIEHMPGAGGINSINYVANAAPLDGTVIAMAIPNFFVTPHIEPKAVRFDAAKFHFVGRMSDFPRVLAAWHTSGARSIDDLKGKEITLGASSRRSTTSVGPMLMNELLGTKIRIVTGYTGTGPTMLALERGEVGSTTVALATLASLYEDRLRDKKIHVIAGMDFAQVPIEGVPRVRDLIKDPNDLALWDFVALSAEFGTAVVMAPGVPQERVDTLRAAFDATVHSEEFKAEAKRRNLDLNPRTGDQLAKLYREHGSPTPEIKARVARIMGVMK